MPAPKTPDGPRIKKEPVKLRTPVNGHVLLHERGRHCLYFNELPRMTHSLCNGGKLWPPCPDYPECLKKPPRAARDTTWLEQQVRRRGS